MKFLTNETEKEGKDNFDMRKEECEEMRIRHKTIRWWKRERWVDGQKVDCYIKMKKTIMERWG